jgi:HSP20 family molecular chaperone IbpA
MFPYFDFNDKFYSFKRPMLERQGWWSTEKDGKLVLLLNVLGVSKEDISLEVASAPNNKQYLNVSGSTKNEFFDKDFSVKMQFLIQEPMKDVTWDVENGFLTAEITFQEPVKPSVNITCK